MTCLLPACLVMGLILVSRVIFSQVTKTDDAYVKGITPNRAKSLVGVAAGLVSLVVGWRAKVRSSRTGNARTTAIVAVICGTAGIILSALHLSMNANGAFGSGGGKAGAIVGLAISLIGMVLGAMALKTKK